MFNVPEKYRETTGLLASTAADGNNGHFVIPFSNRAKAFVIASDGMGWEHVSVHVFSLTRSGKYTIRQERTPTWAEMCRIKDMFWGEDDTVIQIHPPKSEYINNHKHCLHLWRPVGLKLPAPPSILVGIK